MNVGDVVKFKDPNADELNDSFRVIELRGERVLVSDNNDCWDFAGAIRPMFVYLVSELVLA